MKRILLTFFVCVISIFGAAVQSNGFYYSDGSIDTSFVYGVGLNGWVAPTAQAIVLQPDGKIVVAGSSFTTYQGQPAVNMVRLYSSGDRDTTFLNQGFSVATGVHPYYGQVFGLLQQVDGKILVGGSFTSQDGLLSTGMISRINADGTPDLTFNNQAFRLAGAIGTYGPVVIMREQPDGKILVGGFFDKYNGVSANKIIRLNADGTRDTTFNVGSGFATPGLSKAVQQILVQPDGKILVGGSDFVSYQGVSANRIIRLNQDGSIDTTFNVGSGFGGSAVVAFALQPDGKILAGGSFTSYQGVSANRIIRLNTDGTRDTTFNVGSGFDSSTNTIVLQPDGRLFVAGGFTSYQGVPANRIIRLKQDGSIDTTFNAGSGFDTTVYSIVPQIDGSLVIGGGFTSYQGVSANRIIRLSYTKPTITITQPTILSSGSIQDTAIVITGATAIYATGVTIASGSTAGVTGFVCNQINVYEVSCSLSITTSGDVMLSLLDANNNIFTGSATGYIIDTQAPLVSIVSGASVIENGIYTATFTGTDNMSGAIRYECQVGTGGWNDCYSTGYTVGGLGYGNYTFSVRGIDLVGNISNVVTTNFVYVAPVVGFGGGGSSSAGGTTTSTVSTSNQSNNTNTTTSTPVGNGGVNGNQSSQEPNMGIDFSTLYNDGIEDGKCYVRGTGNTIYQGNEATMMFRRSHQMLYSYNLTRWQGTKDYRPEDMMTREEAARFMVEYARNVLCREKVRVYENNFADIADADSTLQNYLKLSYEYGIFKGAEGKFAPNSLLTVDEFSAVLVRLVTNSFLNEEGEDWAKEYRNKVQAYTKETEVSNLLRSNIAEVMYDVYRNNEYTRQNIGYVIK